MIKIIDDFFNKKVSLTDIDNNVFEGIVVDIREKKTMKTQEGTR